MNPNRRFLTARARTLSLVLFLFLPTAAPTAATVTVEAARDATLIEDPDGALANGAGPAFFAGRTNQPQGGMRRGLLYFDVASAVPRTALIEGVSLTLFLTPSNVGPVDIRLHRVLADWGEGASYAAGGLGAPSEPGDATWLHTFYDESFWEYAGGQFVGRESGRLTVNGSEFYTLRGSIHLIQDVRLWIMAPERNFGWIVLGDETRRQTAQAFASRESPDPALRPILTVTYRLPGERKDRPPEMAFSAEAE